MNPKVEHISEKDDTLTFTLSEVNVCFANAIRRTIISDIPIIVFKTTPFEENKANFIVNSTRFHNELLKQRLSCIPICIPNINFPIQEYILEVDETNDTDSVQIVTTEHFKIRNIKSNEYMDKNELRKIFPSFTPSTKSEEYFIDFARLQPKKSDEIQGEQLTFTCEFSIDTAKSNASFNVVETISYRNTPDVSRMATELDKMKQKWKEDKLDIVFEEKNWKLLEGLRVYVKNSFDFIVKGIGIYDNEKIVELACEVLVKKLESFLSQLNIDQVPIESSNTTIENCYDIILVNEDYTLGNVYKYIIYELFYEKAKQLTYCGFEKMHPHDHNSILRIAFVDATQNKQNIVMILNTAIEHAIRVFKSISKKFTSSKR